MITRNEIQTINGAQVLIKTLKSLGTDTIFGYPGGIVLSIYDELYKQSEISHILVRHEQSAVHAAEGYARESGKCGIVLVTSGPGATNTITGINNAYLDGYPMIVFTGQVFKNLIGTDAFQEANICDITKSCTKAVFQITSIKDLQKTIITAHKIAMGGKKGPVVIDMAKDIFTQETGYVEHELSAFNEDEKTYSSEDILRLKNRIENSQRPIFLVGGGVNHSSSGDLVSELSHRTNIPFVSTMMGLGSFSTNDDNYLGMIGIFGDNCANETLRQSDLIISLGSRFNDRISCMFKDTNISEKFIQIDINKNEISRVMTPLDYIIGDLRKILSELTVHSFKSFNDWNKRSKELKTLNKEQEKTSNMLHSFEVIKKIDEFTKDMDITFSAEVGQHQIWAIRNLTLNKNRRIHLSGASGTMGFGFPAAIGSCIAEPQKTVVCISGDGSFQMSIGELALCRDYNLNLKIMILNNGYLGMVRQLQQNNCEGRYSQTKISNPDFIKLAQSYGINAVKVNSSSAIEEALEKAFSTNGPFLIDFEIEPFETL